MRRELLDVEPRRPPGAQVLDQVQHAKLRGVAPSVKHALARERATRRDSIKAPDQLGAVPQLDAVRMALPVQLGVRGNHRRSNPCAALPGSKRTGARGDDL